MTVRLAAEKPTINILLYTDDSQFSASKSFSDFLGLGLMIERLQAHAPTFANLTTTLVNRSTARHADNKLDAVLANGSFDEIWFFGAHQGNTPGEPQSELDASEVNALYAWMRGSAPDGSDGGGVLMTGDHANPLPPNFVADNDGPCGSVGASVDFLGLGRAIGHCVPRAGMLRSWEGPPTFRGTDSFSTLAGRGYQMDRTPQDLFLEHLNFDGEPDPNGEPHPLFFYGPDEFIRVFPDHAHEGAVVIPETLDESWPPALDGGGRTRPHVVARSRDNRNDNLLNILATYNGDLAGVGRIVADSTWHHYTNLNLLGFPNPAPEGTVADQIGQFYANLAVWLAPRSKRLAMGLAMSARAARYAFMQEPIADVEGITQAAKSLLSKSASACEAHELVQVLLPKRFGALAKEVASTRSELQQLRELFLGSVISYHAGMNQEQERARSQSSLSAAELESRNIETLLDTAFNGALNKYRERLTKNVKALGIFANQD